MALAISMGFTLAAGCLDTADARRASTTESGTVVSIGDILEYPERYNGTMVQIRGKVVNQCGAGCWFFLNDGTGTIYIDLLPNNFAIPPLAGSAVTVQGTIYGSMGDVFMVGSSVQSNIGIFI